MRLPARKGGLSSAELTVVLGPPRGCFVDPGKQPDLIDLCPKVPYNSGMEQEKISLRIDADTLAAIRKEAERMRRSLTAQVNLLLEIGLKEVAKKPQK